jgi:hypothetical protein
VLTTKQMVQTQLAGTLIDAFVNMLFSSDSQANAQKQKMMAELQARQAEAERQKQHEEALRLAAICSRLEATLKLSGLPQLQLKGSGQGMEGLRLKLGDSSDGRVGVPGLPGMALNDDSGNGGNTPYGVSDLPGIYTNGPATPATAPAGNTPSDTAGLALKLGDSSGISSLPAQPAPANPPAQSSPAGDPRTMTPQQLADLASNLPPEQQQQLINAMQAGSAAGTGIAVSNALPASATTSPSSSVTHLSATTTVSAAPPPTTTAALAGSNATPASSASASSSAFGQLQQTAAASKEAAAAQTPEDAAAGARIGFDQTAGGAVSAPPARGGSPTAPLNSSNTQPSAAAQAGSTPGHSGTEPAIPTTVNLAVLAPPPPLHSAPPASIVPTTAAAALQVSQPAPALSRVPQMTDRQLQDETCRAHAMLLRIGADSQKESWELQELANEIRQTRREAVKAGLGCFSELAEKAFADRLDDKLDQEEERTHDAAFKKDAKELLKRAQDLQTEIGETTVDYQESDRTREDKLESALKYLNAFFEYVHQGKAFPWVASAQCALDFGYLATKVYMEQQQVTLLNNHQDSAAGSLKAEQSVGAFYKKLVDESLRRGLDPKSACP